MSSPRAAISAVLPLAARLNDRYGHLLPARVREGIIARVKGKGWQLDNPDEGAAFVEPTSERPSAGMAAKAITARVRELAESGDLLGAAAYGGAGLRAHPSDATLARTVRTVAAKSGSLSIQKEAADVLAASGREADVRAAHLVDGRIEVLQPGYLPALPAHQIDSIPGRVLHLLKVSMPHRQSGYAVRSMYTLSGQQEAGRDVLAVTALDFPEASPTPSAPEQVGGVPHLRMTRASTPEGESEAEYTQASAEAFAAVAQDQRPELIHVHSGHRGFDTAQVALAVGQASRLPVVYEVRGFFESVWTSRSQMAEHSQLYDLRMATETAAMTAADAVVTLSESMRADILARGVAPESVFVVPNAVDASAFAPRERDAGLAAQWGLTDRFVFGYVSNLDHYREGHELLIKAAVRLRDEGIPATALIVGDGRRRAHLEALTKELGAQDVVIFTGKVPHAQVLDYYALYDLFIIPRVDERAARLVTPLKPLEAMAAGIPLLVSDLPALTEIIGEGERGLTFPAGDEAALARVIAQVQADPESVRARTQRALEWVRTERSWAANAQRYEQVYQYALAAHQARPKRPGTRAQRRGRAPVSAS